MIRRDPGNMDANPASTLPAAAQVAIIQPSSLDYYLPLIAGGVQVFQGGILLNGGSCCAGGVVGEVITITVELTASSPAGQVTGMRVGDRLAGGCFSESELIALPLEPFTAVRQIPLNIFFVNWIGFYVTAQFYDEQGGASPVYCEDISIEGMPSPP